MGALVQATIGGIALVLWLLIFARLLLSWVDPMGRMPVSAFLASMTEWLLGPIRQMLPRTGTFDFSGLSAFLLLESDEFQVSTELQARLPDLEAWVNRGGHLLVHDRMVAASLVRPNPFLFGASATVLTWSTGSPALCHASPSCTGSI